MSAIIVWSKPKCVQCTAVKRAFDKAGLSYESRNLPDFPAELAAFIEAGFAAAPIVEAEGFDTFSGYDPEAIRRIVSFYRDQAA